MAPAREKISHRVVFQRTEREQRVCARQHNGETVKNCPEASPLTGITTGLIDTPAVCHLPAATLNMKEPKAQRSSSPKLNTTFYHSPQPTVKPSL